MKSGKLLSDFQQMVETGDSRTVASILTPHPRLTPEAQCAIYSNGYRIRLIQAIRSDYPALLSLLGDGAFDTLANRYIVQNPSMHFNLDRYPHAFDRFVTIELSDAFAIDIARLEASIARVFMQPDSKPLPPSTLSGITPEDFAAMTLRLRAASELLAFSYPTHDWLNAHRTKQHAARPEPAITHVLIYRHQNEVRRLPLDVYAHGLLTHMSRGMDVSSALDALVNAHPGCAAHVASHIQAWFAQWVEGGVFAE